MATDTLKGLNIVFPIYNEDGTPFHNLVLRKSVVDSIVMSLGDKITGDVFYKDNTLQVTMKEYVEYNGIHFSLVNPPTIVREGTVADNGELKGMTKYSFEFYHPMYQLSNFPFTDVATKTGEEKYLSQNKSFSWIGKPADFVAKMNKNLDGTEWIVEISSRFPQDKLNELSDVIPFDNATIADACKIFYDTWGVPYVVDKVASTEASYAAGKRFKLVMGLPSNEIYENESARQLGTPYVFQMGQGVGLKNNSRTPRNNKIVTRIAGYGSEDNVPYGYPQIVWTGNQDWDYTINNDPDNPLSYPIYKGIVGGQYVKLIKHPFTRTHLMPSIFTETVNKKVNPNADGYDPTIEIKDYYDAVATQEYPYVNEINLQAPSYESHEFTDIKPELDANRSTGIVSAVPLNSDLTPADHWDDAMDDDGNYLQSYFQITLPQLSFDLYACAAITQEMQINMRSGACIGCTFPVQVDWDDYKRNFYDEEGNFVPDGEQRDLTKYPKSNLGQISVVVQKDNTTFGTLMPNIYQQPKANDLFVFIGISLPLSYIADAEERLDDAMKTYMLENNVYYFDYPLKFDEHFLATHTYILEQIRPNSIIRFDYGGIEQQLFVKQLTVKYGNAPLPQYDITLTDNVEVVLNQIGQVADDVEKLSSLIAVLRQSYNRNVWNELAKKLSKTQDDTAAGFITMLKGLQVGNQFVSGLLGEGGVFRRDADGKTYLEADKMYIRMRAYFDTVEVREYKHSAGNRVASPAGAKCVRVAWFNSSNEELEQVQENLSSVAYFRCYFRADDGEDTVRNNFVVGDQVYCHITTVNGADDNPSTKGLNQKHYWRLCIGKNTDNNLTEDGEGWVDLSNRSTESIGGKNYTGYQTNSDVPEPQDSMVQLGNVNDTTRQGAIIEFVTGDDAPSYQIYQGINSFSLNNKNQIGFGYNTGTGRAYLNVYGDFRFGSRNDNESHIKYNQATKQLDIKANVTFTNVDEMSQFVKDNQNNYNDAWVHTAVEDLQSQIDGEIDNWFYNYLPVADLNSKVPLTNKEPYKTWYETDGGGTASEVTTERTKHLGDTFYDNSSGYAFRFSLNENTENFEWNLITDSAVVQALANAAKAQETADGKRTTYSTWNAWIKNNVNTLEVGDLFIPDTDTTQGGVTYKAKKVYKCTTKGSSTFEEVNYTDDTRVNGFINELLNGQTDTEAAMTAAIKAIRAAVNDGVTTISGGLVLTNEIAMRDTAATPKVWSGISGMYDANVLGGGIASWWGGARVDHEVSPSVADYAKSLVRFDGSGYFAGGNITWDSQGRVAIKDITTLIGNNNTNVLNELTTFNNAFHFNTQQGTTTVLSIVPQVGFTSLNITENGTLKPVATQEWVNQNFVTKTWFDNLFRLYNGSTKINVNDTIPSSDNLNIEAMFGFWTKKYISALGQGDDGSTSYTTLAQLNDVTLTNPTANQILVYDGTHWRNQNQQSVYELPVATTTTLGGIKVGTTLAIASGVLNLPTTGVTAGTYKRVTVDAYGRVTSGDNTDTDTNTWRNIYVGGTSKVGTGIDTKAINFKAGSNVSISYAAAGTGSGQSGNANYFDVVISATDTTYSSATQSAAGLMSAYDKKKLDGVAANANNYSLPLATSGTRGGVQIGFTTDAANRNYAVQLSSEKMYVNVPWENTWRGIQNNLTSDSTTDSLSAAQGKALKGSITTLEGYFTNGVAKSAAKLTTVSKTAWGQTFWTSGGVPTSISGALSSVTNITMSGYIKIGDAYLSYDSTNNAIRVSANADGTGAMNFYARGGVSALGETADGQAGVGDVTWALLADGTDTRQIALSHLTTSLTTITGGTTDSTNKRYAVYKNSSNQLFVDVPWQAGAGTVTSVKVGTTSYTPTNGVISLPAYPTSLPASDVYSWAKASTKPTYSYSEITGTPTIPAAANNGTFSIKTLVGSTTTTISDFTANQSTADDFTLVQGDNVTFTLDTTNRKLTIKATDTTYSVFTASANGLVPMASSGNKTSAETAVGNYYLCADGKFRQLPANAFLNNTYTVNNGSFAIKSKIGTTTTSIGSTSANASGNTDVTLIQGTNVTFTNDATNRTITIAATDTTYSANNGVGLSGTTFYNSGVRATTINGNYLRVNTNGTNADLTIPYATSAGNADTVDNLHASNLVRFFLSPMSSGAPADSAKSWFTGTMPSSSGAIVYNVPGSEKTIIAGKSSGACGHMLQLTYDDKYLRILRYRAGYWQSTDWEKIYAGYADSAGSVAWTNVSSKPAATGGATTPVYWNGSGFTNCTAYSSASVNYANYSGYSNKVLGSYTSNGGKQNPNYFGSNRVGFLMMNTTVNGNSQYKDWVIMDCYSGNDVGGGVAIGVNRQSLGAYIMRSAAARTSWAESAELCGTHNSSVSLSGETLTVKIAGVSKSLTNTNTTYSASTGLSLSGTAFSVSSTYQTYISHGETAYNSLSNYLPLSGGTMTGNLKVKTGDGISDASGAGLLVYHPADWTAVSSSQWGVGAIDCEGVIRSSASALKHYRLNDGTYEIIDSKGGQTINNSLQIGSSNGAYLQIGAIRLVYDSSNNAVKVIKSDGGNANLYATGGVSALGAGQESGGGGDVTWALLASPATGGRTIHSSYISSALSNYLPLSGGTMNGTITFGYIANTIVFQGGAKLNTYGNLNFNSSTASWNIRDNSNNLIYEVSNQNHAAVYYGSGQILLQPSEGYGAVRLKGNNRDIGLHIGSGGMNRGIYDFEHNNWGLYFGDGYTAITYGWVAIGDFNPYYKLHVDGTVGATGFTNTSDIRKKNVIKDVDLRLDQIAKAPAFEYYWLDPSIDHDLHVGTSAQYWESVLPQVVTTAKDEIGTKAMQYGVAALISTITVARKVMTHEEKIALLETRVSALEKENGEQEMLINSLQEELAKFKAA